MGTVVSCEHELSRFRNFLLQKGSSGLMLIEKRSSDLREAENGILGDTLCRIARYQ